MPVDIRCRRVPTNRSSWRETPCGSGRSSPTCSTTQPSTPIPAASSACRYALRGRGRRFGAHSGVGISPQHLPQIFEMFSQVTPAVDRSQGGLGIGLSLVRGLVECTADKSMPAVPVRDKGVNLQCNYQFVSMLRRPRKGPRRRFQPGNCESWWSMTITMRPTC